MARKPGGIEDSNFKVAQDDRKSFASLVFSDFTPAPTEVGYFGILALASSPPVVNCSHLNMWGGGGQATYLQTPPFPHLHIRTSIYVQYCTVYVLQCTGSVELLTTPYYALVFNFSRCTFYFLFYLVLKVYFCRRKKLSYNYYPVLP